MKFNKVFTKERYENHLEWLDDSTKGEKLDLRYANLRHTDFSYANLRDADLRDADFKGVDFKRVGFKGANLRCCIGNNKEIKSLQIGSYLVVIYKDIINIGCKSHTLGEWKNFTDEEISKMDDKALDWWKLNKDIVISIAEREI